MTQVSLVIISFIVFISQVSWTWGEQQPMNYYSAQYGLLCYDSCDLHGGSYYWCNTRDGWDTCSPKPNVDLEGNECRSDHPCGWYGEAYSWCYKSNGGWAYCGIVQPKIMSYKSATYLASCIDDCRYDEKYEYFWCYTSKGWDYCSPSPDVSYKNEPCSSGSTCGTHGSEYSWCYTGGWTSSYCGVIDASECQSKDKCVSRTKRQPDNRKLICTVKDENREVANMYAEENNNNRNFAQVNNKMKNEIDDLIAKWDNCHLGNQARSDLIKYKNKKKDQGFRLDLQGTFNQNNQPHYNLQIQINEPRRSGGSTTVAQVILPQNVEIPNYYVQLAFSESLNRQARVFITATNNNCRPRRSSYF